MKVVITNTKHSSDKIRVTFSPYSKEIRIKVPKEMNQNTSKFNIIKDMILKLSTYTKDITLRGYIDSTKRDILLQMNASKIRTVVSGYIKYNNDKYSELEIKIGEQI